MDLIDQIWNDSDFGGGGGGGGGGGSSGTSPKPAPIDYDAVQRILQQQFAKNPPKTGKLIALLFGRPQVELVTQKIVPNSEYWHHRSGNSLDFFCIGFSSSPAIQWDAKKFTETLDRFESE